MFLFENSIPVKKRIYTYVEYLYKKYDHAHILKWQSLVIYSSPVYLENGQQPIINFETTQH